MKRTVFIVLGLLFMAMTTNAQTVFKSLQDLRDAYSEAFANQDTEAILKIYSDDASIHHTDGSMINGTAEIRNLYNGFFKENSGRIDFKNVSEDQLTDDIFFYHDKVFVNINGEDNTRDIEVVNIAERKDGKWRVTKSYRWPKP
ncbi:hypothetical protein GCM10023115_49250 [Pontixanthobacter gangjinensis]|uniref:Nuclear transport factor 2 family protein n=1 Tax=Christiangramia aestuarii TaxID=1028746 RepID=A0A7K1LNZ4_9FLAO|nr:nuclear transport factor 2 family protein [Christiangramia aestuarii]MUP42506.1 nuclear transport factor 2 family protein [Christiangramia aestuarii]